MQQNKSSLRGLLTPFSIVGPGLVFVLSVVGPGDIVSNAAAGAQYGYALIWILLVTIAFRFVWVSTSAKYVLVTGETLLQGFDRLGRWVSWVLLVSILVMRHALNLYKVLLVGQAANLILGWSFPSSSVVLSLVLTFFGTALIIWGGYPLIEQLFRVLVAGLGGALFLAAWTSSPDFSEILRGTFIPSIPEAQGLYGTAFLMLALIGTEAGSMTNLTYSYFMYEKGWRDPLKLRRQRTDLAIGVLCIFLMGATLQIASAGTLGALDVRLEETADLVGILAESQGVGGIFVFGLGLFAAVFTGLVGATTGYALIVRDLIRRILFPGSGGAASLGASRKDWVFRGCVLFWMLSPLYILLTDVRPLWLLLAVSGASALMLPFLGICLLVLTSDRKLMGSYRNSFLTNLIILTMIVSSLLLAGKVFLDWLQSSC